MGAACAGSVDWSLDGDRSLLAGQQREIVVAVVRRKDARSVAVAQRQFERDCCIATRIAQMNAPHLLSSTVDRHIGLSLHGAVHGRGSELVQARGNSRRPSQPSKSCRQSACQPDRATPAARRPDGCFSKRSAIGSTKSGVVTLAAASTTTSFDASVSFSGETTIACTRKPFAALRVVFTSCTVWSERSICTCSGALALRMP